MYLAKIIAWVLVSLAHVALAQAPSAPTAPTPAEPPAPPQASPGALPPLEVDALDLLRVPPPAAPAPEADLGSTKVLGRRRALGNAASRFVVDLGKLDAIPRKSAAEHLMLAPGVLTTNVGGEGHAQETFMRGFAAGEGKDIEFLVDGVPLNEVSNPHTHGYTDLNFLPPEIVQSVDVAQGPFDPVQGDFAFAGTARYNLGVPQRGSRATYGIGTWNSHRALLLVAPEGLDPDTFGAVEYTRSDGFGANRASQRAAGVGRYRGEVGSLQWTLSGYGAAARFDQAGVVRQDDYALGRQSFFGTYDPNQGGSSTRFLTSLSLESSTEDSRLEQVFFVGWRSFSLRENFTGWTTDTAAGTGNPQRGDGLELRYDTLTTGTRGSWALSGLLGGLRQELAMGWAVRVDHGDNASVRLRSVSGIPYSTVFSNSFTVGNLAAWLRAEVQPWSWLSLRAGARLDTFLFDVTDTNQPTSDREGERLREQTARSMGYALNPRASVELRPWEPLAFVVSYGQGTRSTEATALSDNETAPFARSQQVEAGARFRLGEPSDALRFSAQLAYVYAEVTQDLLFDETEGRNVLVGSTTRHAGLAGLRLDVQGWLDVLLNCGVTEATLDATGERLPYIPRWVLRADVAAQGALGLGSLAGVPVTGRVGVGFTFVPGRPLPYAQTGDPFYLINLGAQVRLWHVSLGVDVRNLLDQRYRQSEFSYASNFRAPDAPPSQLPVRHFVAGEPLWAMATLTLHLEDMVRGFLPTDAQATSEE